MRPRYLLGPALVLLFGCSGQAYKVAPVSGKVTLDGKPLPKAAVHFIPMATKENQSPGKTSFGETDADGRYRLVIDPATPGSVVGKSRVYITTFRPDPSVNDRDAGRPMKMATEVIPEKYNTKTELTFEVPAAGTDQANFDLTSW
jgi:hypothetical protein